MFSSPETMAELLLNPRRTAEDRGQSGSADDLGGHLEKQLAASSTTAKNLLEALVAELTIR
jgi:hypothetical protein